MRSLTKLIAFCALTVLAFSGCQAVKPYQTQQLKDEAMQTNASALEKLEGEAETYREGASGGMGGKTGGGCGCN